MLRKKSYWQYICVVQLKNVLYNKFIDSHLWFIFLHNTTSCTCRLELFLVFIGSYAFNIPLTFSQKRRNIEVASCRLHFEFLTTFGTFDTTFARQISVMLTHAQTFYRGIQSRQFWRTNAAALIPVQHEFHLWIYYYE